MVTVPELAGKGKLNCRILQDLNRFSVCGAFIKGHREAKVKSWIIRKCPTECGSAASFPSVLHSAWIFSASTEKRLFSRG